MALGSFTHGALAELSGDKVSRMLELDETLFVEHKGDVGDDKDTMYGLVSTVAAFANTYLRWLAADRGSPTESRMATRR